MTHHEDLAEADRLIADCMDRIARQREIITTRYEQGLPTDVAESMLRALEESLRALVRHQILLHAQELERELTEVATKYCGAPSQRRPTSTRCCLKN